MLHGPGRLHGLYDFCECVCVQGCANSEDPHDTGKQWNSYQSYATGRLVAAYALNRPSPSQLARALDIVCHTLSSVVMYHAHT